MKKGLNSNISFRLKTKELLEFETFIEENELFESPSQAARIFCLFGMRYFKLQKLAENPEFIAKLEKQFNIQIVRPSFDSIINNMTPDEIDALMLKLKDVQDNKINEMLAE